MNALDRAIEDNPHLKKLWHDYANLIRTCRRCGALYHELDNFGFRCSYHPATDSNYEATGASKYGMGHYECCGRSDVDGDVHKESIAPFGCLMADHTVAMNERGIRTLGDPHSCALEAVPVCFLPFMKKVHLMKMVTVATVYNLQQEREVQVSFSMPLTPGTVATFFPADVPRFAGINRIIYATDARADMRNASDFYGAAPPIAGSTERSGIPFQPYHIVRRVAPAQRPESIVPLPEAPSTWYCVGNSRVPRERSRRPYLAV